MYAKHILIFMLALLMATAGVSAKKKSQVQKIYIFGLSASFTDTIVHFTNIQEVDSAWMSKSKNMLRGREQYSYQLRDYLSDQLLMPHRTCIVVYDTKRKKLEKKYTKMQRIYSTPPQNGRRYDVRYIAPENFRFHSVDMSAIMEQELQEEQESKAPKKAPKLKKVDKEPRDLKNKNNDMRRPPRGM